MEYFCNLMVSYLNKLDLVHQEMKPLPYLTNMIEGCVATGKDVTAGGAIYNYSGPQGVGVGSVGDGLATIKQLVFDEKKVTGRELLDAVRDNWVGHEKLYALVNSDYVHHYGNDDDYADQLAKFGEDGSVFLGATQGAYDQFVGIDDDGTLAEPVGHAVCHGDDVGLTFMCLQCLGQNDCAFCEHFAVGGLFRVVQNQIDALKGRGIDHKAGSANAPYFVIRLDGFSDVTDSLFSFVTHERSSL